MPKWWPSSGRRRPASCARSTLPIATRKPVGSARRTSSWPSRADVDQPRVDRRTGGRRRLAWRLRTADAPRIGTRDAGDGVHADDQRAAVVAVLDRVVGAELHDGGLVLEVLARSLRSGGVAHA